MYLTSAEIGVYVPYVIKFLPLLCFAHSDAVSLKFSTLISIHGFIATTGEKMQFMYFFLDLRLNLPSWTPAYDTDILLSCIIRLKSLLTIHFKIKANLERLGFKTSISVLHTVKPIRHITENKYNPKQEIAYLNIRF